MNIYRNLRGWYGETRKKSIGKRIKFVQNCVALQTTEDYGMKLSLPLASGGFHAPRWVGAGPGHVGGRAVARRDRLAQQPQGNAEFRPTMRPFNPPPPQNPYSP